MPPATRPNDCSVTCRVYVTLRNPETSGFLRTANRGATQAQGHYLLFLNNDTQVPPGWLDRLVEVFTTIRTPASSAPS